MLKFQLLPQIIPTLFVQGISCFKQDKTAIHIEFSSVIAVFTNSFCPISRNLPFTTLHFTSAIYFPFLMIFTCKAMITASSAAPVTPRAIKRIVLVVIPSCASTFSSRSLLAVAKKSISSSVLIGTEAENSLFS